MKKLVCVFCFGLLLTTSCFAGMEDWHGTFTILDTKGNQNTITHIPTYIFFLFMRTKTYKFSKGSRLNDIVATDNGSVTLVMSVDSFEAEVKKLGTLVGQQIILGPTYTTV